MKSWRLLVLPTVDVCDLMLLALVISEERETWGKRLHYPCDGSLHAGIGRSESSILYDTVEGCQIPHRLFGRFGGTLKTIEVLYVRAEHGIPHAFSFGD